jgi:hypothetical protein
VLGGIVSASIARMLAYQATGGQEGVAGTGDWRVHQTTVASGSVRIDAGGGIMVNRYPGVKNESCVARSGDETVIAIPANGGGSTRYDLVIARVDDWNFPGAQPVPGTLPTDTVPVAKSQVITGVSSSTKTAKQLNLNYPAIALARIAMPAGGSSVTDAIITDLRRKAVPRRERMTKQGNSTGTPQAGAVNALTNSAYAAGDAWPDAASFAIEVPEWATKAIVRADVTAAILKAGNASGQFIMTMNDANASEYSSYDENYTGSPHRTNLLTTGQITIPEEVRGTTATFRLKGRRTSGSGYLDADSFTATILDIEFLEETT